MGARPRLLLLAAMALALLGRPAPAAVADPASVVAEFTVDSDVATVRGTAVKLTNPVRLRDGVPWGPLRAVGEALGGRVGWDAATRTATLSAPDGSHAIAVVIAAAAATADGRPIPLPGPVYLEDNRTQVPLDLLARAFGLAGEWHGAGRYRLVGSAPGASAPVTAPATAPAEVVIVISGFQFSPAAASVPPGSVVRWVNRDRAPHQVVSNPPGLFRSPVLSAGQEFTWPAGGDGTVAYRCEVHPSMTGTLTIQP